MSAAEPSAVGSELEALHASGLIGALDLHFARTLSRLGGEHDPRVLLAVALLSRTVQAGHVCLELPVARAGLLALAVDPAQQQALAALVWPDTTSWLAALRASPLVGGKEGLTPLCLDREGRLYLRRYFAHERGLARALVERAARPAQAADAARLHDGLRRLFDQGNAQATPAPAKSRPRAAKRPRQQLDLFEREAPQQAGEDLQRVAAECALTQALCVISGGPGTGKTSTVVKILALLLEQAQVEQPSRTPRVLLLAPTGKAAARLGEAIKRSKGELDCAPSVRDAIPEDASTIHRALGVRPGGGTRFRHHRDNPLAADVVVVDEASMVDLLLMARLLDALPVAARVILLGDKNQLYSVEAGAVLGDICAAGLDPGASAAPIGSSIVQLTRSYRYAADSGIGRLADAINDAQPDRVLEILRDPRLPEVALVETRAGSRVPRALFEAAVEQFGPFFEAAGPAAKLRALERFRVLCAHRHGTHGQLAVNAGIEQALRESGLVPATPARYSGQPLIVTQNDHQARLYNGDVGVLLEDEDEPGRLHAFFAAGDGALRQVAAARLPPHEGVYAMSVHKSQGSELEQVALLLPPEPSPVLSRELLYTAVTRARRRVVIYASPEVLAAAVRTAVQRASGLRALLRAPEAST